MLETIGKATNKNPLIYASPKNFCPETVLGTATYTMALQG
jgi:hypothetical protein